MAKSFAEITKKDENSVLVVDLLNLAFRWKHQGRSDFRNDIVSTIESFANSFSCKKIIVLADNRGSSFRKEIFPEYKANRKKLQETQTEEEKLAFEKFIQEYVASQEVIAEKYPFFCFEGVEADDLAAYIVKERNNYGFEKIWLLSSDKDWDLLIDEGITRFSYVTRKETTLENWSEHHPVDPNHYISFKCLCGDSGDNIPGISGIGPKRAATVIETYGSALDIYDATPLLGKYKYIQNLNEQAEQLLINYQLMDLLTFCEDAIGPENLLVLKEKLNDV